MSKGKVKWFDERKGFGFITPDDAGEDLFVHHTNIIREGFRCLNDGDVVEYEVGEGGKGPEATNVRSVEGEPAEGKEGGPLRSAGPLSLIIDPGDCTPEELSELFIELSTLYRMAGGSGVNFTIVDAKEPAIA